MYRLSQNGVEWTTSLEDRGGAIDQSSWATNESQATYTIDVPFHKTGNVSQSMLRKTAIAQDVYEATGNNLHQAIARILGFTRYNGTGVNLLRACPARHPLYPWLRATKITAVTPIGKEFLREQSPLGRITGTDLPVLIHSAYRFTILFQSLTYEALEDAEVTTERERFVTEEVQARSEILERQGGQFYFVAGTPPGNTDPQTAFPQPIGMLVGSYDLVLTWHSVPREAIFNAMYPTKIVSLLGKVNNDSVRAPYVAPGAKLGLGGTYSYSPGVMLFTGVEIRPEQAPVAPQIMGLGNIFRTPRTYTVRYIFAIDPRGHNLKPWAGNNTWYLVTHNGLAPVDGKTIYEPAALVEELFKPL